MATTFVMGSTCGENCEDFMIVEQNASLDMVFFVLPGASGQIRAWRFTAQT